MNETTITRAVIEDAAALAELGASTFSETFGHLYPPEDLQTFLSTTHSLENWRDVLSKAGNDVLLAKDVSGANAGFALVGTCKLPVEDLEADAGEIRQLYVQTEFQNRGLGARLMDEALACLARKNRKPVYIGVWSENFGAQRFYARYGFTKVGEYGFRVGSTIDHEFILKG